MKIIADQAIPFLRGVLEPWAQVRYLPGREITADDVRDADALIVRTRTRCNAQLLEGSTVRLVVTATIGADHIDTAWCAAHNIHTATAAGCNARGVLQWVAAVLVHLSQIQGWHPSERTLGVVGVGHVGSLVKAYTESWGFRVLCCDPPREAREHLGFLPLEELVRQADLLTFHTPLDATTHHLVNATLLRQTKANALIINSSRGEVVDGEALAASDHPFVLDVWEHEPQLAPQLLHDALLATPHIAGYSEQGKATATAMSVATIARFFALPLSNWYPCEAALTAPRAISWQELCTTITAAFDLAAESRRLKEHPTDFEQMRDNYRYRREYF
ncbi:MAG: 4-phosphoerythronate dehydrogenase [Alistipes sp.]